MNKTLTSHILLSLLSLALISVQALEQPYNRTCPSTNLALNKNKVGYPNITTSLIIYQVQIGGTSSSSSSGGSTSSSSSSQSTSSSSSTTTTSSSSSQTTASSSSKPAASSSSNSVTSSSSSKPASSSSSTTTTSSSSSGTTTSSSSVKPSSSSSGTTTSSSSVKPSSSSSGTTSSSSSAKLRLLEGIASNKNNSSYSYKNYHYRYLATSSSSKASTSSSSTSTPTYLPPPLYSNAWDLLDGIRNYNLSNKSENGTYRGFKFNSGKQYSNSTWENVAIDFGKTITFTRVLICIMSADNVPSMYKLETYNDTIKDYLPIYSSFGQGRKNVANYSFVNDWMKNNSKNFTNASLIEHNFTATNTTKLRLSLHTIDIPTGWLCGIEVYNDPVIVVPVPTKPCVINITDTAGKSINASFYIQQQDIFKVISPISNFSSIAVGSACDCHLSFFNNTNATGYSLYQRHVTASSTMVLPKPLISQVKGGTALCEQPSF